MTASKQSRVHLNITELPEVGDGARLFTGRRLAGVVMSFDGKRPI